MDDQDQYGRYMAQQPQQIHINQSNNSNGNSNGSGNTPYPDSDYAQSSTGATGQQQVMYGEYAEQSQHREGEYRNYEVYGAHEYYGGNGEKLRPVQPVRHSRRWFWPLVVLALVVVMMVGGIFGYRGGEDKQFGPHMMGMPFAKNVTNMAFNLPDGMIPRLVIYDTNGTVIVHSGGDNSMIMVNVASSDRSRPVPVKFDKQDDVLSVDMSGFDSGADITVTTPSNVNVQVQDRSGDVQMSGINGQVSVQDNDGAITLDHFDGQANLTSQDGSIQLSQSRLSGQSSIQTQSGSIDFHGSLSQQGNYTFETADGDIHLALPSDASFHLINTPGNGTMHNDFNGNDVGSAPRPPLNVSSQSGDITISQGQ